MSWFEKAKTALIEALDIQEDERGIENTAEQPAPAITQTQQQQQNQEQQPPAAPGSAVVAPDTAKQHDTPETITTSSTTASLASVNPKALPGSTISAWGSFTGSFFENPKANEMITTAPTSASAASRSPSTTTSPDTKLRAKRQSSTSTNSESIDLLTNTATSPTDAIIQQIPSDEQVTTTATPSSEIADNETSGAGCTALPDSLVIIDTQSKSSNDDCSPDEQIPEQRMLDSDSTQSFEELQMATSILTLGSEDNKTDFEKITTPSYSSPPHSNDEIETTTSSDIEIISNPNGDSSSTHSATRTTSPLKLKKFAKTQPTAGATGASISQTRAACAASSSVNPTTVASGQKRGHCREASEISILSEDSQTELDKLVQRISELNEILEARELRLLQSERQNAMLQERNHSLQQTVDNLKSNTQQHDSTQQLSALEKKFQTSLQECDALRIQIKTLKQELQLKIPKKELDESKAMVSELQLEGEKLSKEILHQSNIIKKLRAKEKTTEATLKKNAEQLAQLSDEVERLKKTLSAKEEVERTQIETIHKMSSDKRKLNDELAQQRSKVEDLQSKLGTVQTSFEAVKSELQQRTRQHTDLTRTAEEVAEAKRAKEQAAAENEEMLQQLGELREKLRSSEQHSAKREQQLREENRELLRRLEAAELRAESTTEDVSLATIPLLRQIESLQKTLNQRTSNWNREEKQLLEKLQTSESRLKSLESIESTFQEQIDILRNRCIELEEQLSSAVMQAESAKIAQRGVELDISLKETNLNRQITQLKNELEAQQSKLEELQERNRQLETKVLTKTASTETTMASVLTEANVGEITRLAEQQQHALMQQHQHSHSLQRPSPPHSYGVNSLEDAIGGNVDWQADDMDCVSQAGGGPPGAASSFGHGLNISFMSNNTSTLEHLQSLLKQRDGEVSHLQWELSRLQAERNVYNEEITNLTVELENLKDKLPGYEAMERSMADLQTRYEALLEMYGEKVERMQELELDLVEARQAYKVQIDELLSQRNTTT